MENFEKYRSTFVLANVGIIQLRPDGTIIEANPRFCQMMKRSQYELLRMKIQDITHPDDLQVSNENFAKMNQGDMETIFFEKRYLQKDGSYFWGSVDARLILNEKGQPDYYVSIIRDITVQKLQDLEKETKAKLEALRKISGGLALELRQPLFEIFENSKRIRELNHQKRTQGYIDQNSAYIEDNVMKIINVINSLETLWKDSE